MFFAPVVATRTSRSFDRSFDRFLNSTFHSGLAVTQDDTAWTVSLDLPGVAREDLTLNLEGALVYVATKEGAKRAFKQTYELPEEIDETASEAKLENGVLTLKLAKKQPVSKLRALEIK